MFSSAYGELNDLKEIADILVSKMDWPALYDEKQLVQNEARVYASTYVDNMYVHFTSATATKIKGLSQFITNVMYHNVHPRRMRS